MSGGPVVWPVYDDPAAVKPSIGGAEVAKPENPPVEKAILQFGSLIQREEWEWRP
jgi:hypothetical protein